VPIKFEFVPIGINKEKVTINIIHRSPIQVQIQLNVITLKL